jgi:hypothetical protein
MGDRSGYARSTIGKYKKSRKEEIKTRSIEKQITYLNSASAFERKRVYKSSRLWFVQPGDLKKKDGDGSRLFKDPKYAAQNRYPSYSTFGSSLEVYKDSLKREYRLASADETKVTGVVLFLGESLFYVRIRSKRNELRTEKPIAGDLIRVENSNGHSLTLNILQTCFIGRRVTGWVRTA